MLQAPQMVPAVLSKQYKDPSVQAILVFAATRLSDKIKPIISSNIFDL